MSSVGSSLLAPLKVLDLSRILAAPFCTQLLADMGATVYKIEEPTKGDDTREWGPPFTKQGHESTYFLSANRNKQSVAVNIKHPDGAEIVRRLATKCDVLVENFPARKLEEFGLGYQQLSLLNPRLVYCNVSGFGDTGPYRNRLAYDVIVSGLGGLLGITGTPDTPSKVGVAISDVCAGLFAHGAILAAVLARERTGKGAYIDVSLLDTQIATLVNVASAHLVTGAIPQRMGTAHSSIVPYQAFAAQDGHFIAGALNDGQFVRMCEGMGLEYLSSDSRYATNPSRVANRDELIGILSTKFKEKPVKHWLDVMEQCKVPAGPINDLKQVFEDPQVIARNMQQTVQHPTCGDVRMLSPPVRFDGEQCDIRIPPPTLGQHTEKVLREELGYSSDYVQALRDKKVVR